ncbi:MAG: hypothetical protein FWD91_01835 [Treponema sp.]|nr:hypothetical protein [Treponema sp.]
MTFSERMKGMLDQGVAVSKEFAVKAGAKAQDIGERSVLMLEVKQLDHQANKLAGRLGAEVYQAFTERGEETLSKENPVVKALLSEITTIRDSIEKKEAELAMKKGKG